MFWPVHRSLGLSTLALVFAFSIPVFSQCLSANQIDQMVAKIRSGETLVKDDKLRKELLSMKKDVLDALRDRVAEENSMKRQTRGRAGGESRVDSVDQSLEGKRQKTAARICEILKTKGFPGKSVVGDEGVAAAFYLVKQFLPVAEQIQIVPVINAAIDKGELPKNDDYAAFVDRLRVSVGLKQLFGTQAFVRGNFLMLAPIANEATVDQRRAAFNMGPLDDYLKYLERQNRMPLMRDRSIGPPILTKSTVKPVVPELTPTGTGGGDDEVIRIDTELVDLNVRVSTNSPTSRVPSLDTSDFRVFEDGRQQEISLFQKTDTPFDLVVLIDMSGSSQNQVGLIRNAARGFIDAARPGDRVSVATFSDKVKVLSPLTSDRGALRKAVDNIDDIGYSHVWDGLLYAVENIFGGRPPERRRAIVVLTDGVDNALTNGRDPGSKTSFAKLLETVRNDDVLVLPIHLNSYGSERSFRRADSDRVDTTARETLSVLAEETGGQAYYAKKIEDINGIYQTVLTDLGTVYSIGYTPTNEKRDGSWRSVKVEIKGHPELTPRTRHGYYAKK
jgi:VWFA-related protein